MRAALILHCQDEIPVSHIVLPVRGVAVHGQGDVRSKAAAIEIEQQILTRHGDHEAAFSDFPVVRWTSIQRRRQSRKRRTCNRGAIGTPVAVREEVEYGLVSLNNF